MTLTLYTNPVSPPSRSVVMTINALGLQDKVTLVTVNPLAGDHLKPEFLEKNPVHTIPTLEDGDFVLWDSHAINAYLINKYGKNDDLYPKDPKKRALVDCMNHFETGYIFAFGVAHMRSRFMPPEEFPEKEKNEKKLFEALDMLETILERRPYVAGDHVTIADISLLTTVSSLNQMSPLQPTKYLKVLSWLEKMKALPYYRINHEGLEATKVFAETAKKMLQKK